MRSILRHPSVRHQQERPRCPRPGPSSSSFRNISTPVTTVFRLTPTPPTPPPPALHVPRSIRARRHRPRPVMENTSSTGIRNGRSMAPRLRNVRSMASIRSWMHCESGPAPRPARAFSALPLHHRNVVPGEVVVAQKLPQPPVQPAPGSFRVVHHVHLVQEGTTMNGTFSLDEPEGCASRVCGIGSVPRAHHQDRSANLRAPVIHVSSHNPRVQGSPRAP